jgi:uncharacterized protein
VNELLLLAGAGLLAGAMNALAGGGSFVTLPALIAVGVPSVVANASSTVALFPGGVVSVWVYRDGLNPVCGVPLRPILVVSLIGGLLGALLLIWTPTALFDRALPWLLLAATLALTFGRRLGAAMRARFTAGIATVLVVQFVLGIYAGYFGGAVGLMMLTVWSLLDSADIKALNPPRALMVTAANAVAVICFIIAGAISWPHTFGVAAGAAVGGYGGAQLGRWLPANVVRVATVMLAIGITVVFFVRAYS